MGPDFLNFTIQFRPSHRPKSVLPPKAQLGGRREYQRVEVGGMFAVMPHLKGVGIMSSIINLEFQGLDFTNRSTSHSKED